MSDTGQPMETRLVPTLNGSAVGQEVMASTPHPLATRAALDILRAGGTAVDAAIAANAVLCVVMPDQCSLGGDLFALVYDPRVRRAVGLNGSGAAPQRATITELLRRGFTAMPSQGPLSITVPGTVKAWETLSRRWGRLAWTDLFGAAIEHAAQGFAVTPQLSHTTTANQHLITQSSVATSLFLRDGHGLHPGERLIQPQLAEVFRSISGRGSQAFYAGDIAAEIAQAVQAAGGLLTEADLHDQQAEWVEPISIQYRGQTVYSLPPNSSGALFLAILNQLGRQDIASLEFQSPAYIARCVAAVSQAFAEGYRQIADPRFVQTEWRQLIAPDWGGGSRTEARPVDINLPGDTVYLCVADKDGMGVSLIQSIYFDFGSGLHVDALGFFLQNRGASFSLKADDPNCLASGKRPRHTLMPAMVSQNDSLTMLLGTRGGDGQSQTLAQLLSGMIDFGLSPQYAIESPRWVWGGTSSARRTAGIALEDSFPASTFHELRALGFPVQPTDPLSVHWMGCAQAVVMDSQHGRLLGGADPRGGGLAQGW